MSTRKTGDKGRKTEEIVRNYFLRAGFYAIRSVPIRKNNEDLTDVDLWLYERSGTLARRRTIIDIKDKARPQAAERLFFVKGLSELLRVDAAGIATSDPRLALKELARSYGLLWLDGADLQRMKSSPDLVSPERASEEDLDEQIRLVDNGRGSTRFRDALFEMKSAVGDSFGPACANRCLDVARAVAREAISSHPNSPAARLGGRLTYLSASLAGIALDFVSADTALRSMMERTEHLTDAIRYGADAGGVREKLRWAETAIKEYAPNGAGIARIVREKLRGDLMSVPAEGLASVVAKFTRSDDLFNICRHLERSAYCRDLDTFDILPSPARSYLGAILDFVNVDRVAFATAWSAAHSNSEASGDPTGSDDVEGSIADKEPPDSDRRLL